MSEITRRQAIQLLGATGIATATLNDVALVSLAHNSLPAVLDEEFPYRQRLGWFGEVAAKHPFLLWRQKPGPDLFTTKATWSCYGFHLRKSLSSLSSAILTDGNLRLRQNNANPARWCNFLLGDGYQVRLHPKPIHTSFLHFPGKHRVIMIQKIREFSDYGDLSFHSQETNGGQRDILDESGKVVGTIDIISCEEAKECGFTAPCLV